MLMLVGLCSVLGASHSVCAMVLTNQHVTLKQPDGTVLKCMASGDEHFNFFHDEDGFLIMPDSKTGSYVYVKYENDEFIPTTIVAKTGIKLSNNDKKEIADKDTLKLSKKTLKKYGNYRIDEENVTKEAQLAETKNFTSHGSTPHHQMEM